MAKEFDSKLVNEIIKKLKKDGYKAFHNEAHMQMIFIKTCYDLEINKSFELIPEYPVDCERNKYTIQEKDSKKFYSKTTESKDESGFLDLLIINKETGKKTAVEFKYLTINNAKLKASKNYKLKEPCPFIDQIEPSRMLAQDQRRFDCWSDIERMEKLISNGKISNGFFILITNDESYWNEAGTNKLLSIKNGEEQKSGTKEWTCTESELTNKVKSYGKSRMRTINIKNDYKFVYKEYSKFKIDDSKKVVFNIAVVKIKAVHK